MSKTAKFFWGIVIVVLHPQFIETLFKVPHFISNSVPVVIGYFLLLSVSDSIFPRTIGWKTILYSGAFVGFATIPYLLIDTSTRWIPKALSVVGVIFQCMIVWCIFYNCKVFLEKVKPSLEKTLKKCYLTYIVASTALILKEVLEFLLRGAIPMWVYSLHAICCLTKTISGFLIVVILFEITVCSDYLARE